MDDWMPIESAPKDGTPVLVPNEPSGWPDVVVAFCTLGDWWTGGEDGCFISPTHWMPLPTPPVSE